MTSWGKEQREGLQETWLTSWRFLARTLKMHFFRSTLTQFCMSTGGQEGAGSCSNKASLAGSGYGFHKPSANFWKTLKAREISLLAKKMIKWKQPPFKRLMSSVSAKKRPGSPLWEPRVTSPPIRALLPSSAAPSWGGMGRFSLGKCHSFTHKAPWPCLFAGFHCQVKEGPWEGWPEWVRGCAQLAWGALFTQHSESSIFPSATQTQASGPNAAPRQCCQCWILWTV